MKSKGVSGFGVIFYILLFVVIGYVGYQIARVHFTYGSMSNLVESIVEEASMQPDYNVFRELMEKAKEMNIELNADSIFVDRGIPDSFRIYVAYTDSSSIFDFFYYKRHFTIDKIEPMKVKL